MDGQDRTIEGQYLTHTKTHTNQICLLIQEGREVLLVTSGAVGVGRQLLSKQARLSLSVRDVVSGTGCVFVVLYFLYCLVCVWLWAIVRSMGSTSVTAPQPPVTQLPPSFLAPSNSPKKTKCRVNSKGSGYDSACAAAGQLGLMSLYETLFSTRQVATSQVRDHIYIYIHVHVYDMYMDSCVLIALGVVVCVSAIRTNSTSTTSSSWKPTDRTGLFSLCHHSRNHKHRSW